MSRADKDQLIGESDRARLVAVNEQVLTFSDWVNAADAHMGTRRGVKTFALIVTFAATTDLIGGARTECIASFDDYQACAAAGQALYSQQHWECVPENEHSKDAPASR